MRETSSFTCAASNASFALRTVPPNTDVFIAKVMTMGKKEKVDLSRGYWNPITPG